MTKITIELPNELEFIRKVHSTVLTLAVIKMLKDRAEEIKDIERIVAKSQLTEADVEELTDKINLESSKHYSKY